MAAIKSLRFALFLCAQLKEVGHKEIHWLALRKPYNYQAEIRYRKVFKYYVNPCGCWNQNILGESDQYHGCRCTGSCISRPSATMILLIMQDKQVPIFHKEAFQIPCAISVLSKMKNAFFYISKNYFSLKRVKQWVTPIMQFICSIIYYYSVPLTSWLIYWIGMVRFWSELAWRGSAHLKT